MSDTRALSAVPRAFIAALAFAVAFSAGADGEPYSQDTLGLYRLSGLESEIASMELQIVENISIQTQPLPEDIRRTLIESVGEQFDSGAVRAAALARLEEGRIPEHAKAALEWLRSPVGRRITKIEETGSTRNGFLEIQAYARTLAEKPPPQDRVAFAERLDSITGATDLAVNASLGSSLVIAVVINATRPVPDQMNLDALREVIEAQREPLRPLMQQLTLVSFLYMVRELPEGDLERYIGFLESDSGAWYNALASKVTVQALATLSVRIGEVLGEALSSMGTKRSL